jgi:hypothetical protein
MLRNNLIASFSQPDRHSKFCFAKYLRHMCRSSPLQRPSNDPTSSRCCSRRPAGASSNSFLIEGTAVSKNTTKRLKIILSIKSRPQDTRRTVRREYHGYRQVRPPKSYTFEEQVAAQPQEVVHHHPSIPPLTHQQVLCAAANALPVRLLTALCLPHPREWNRGQKSFICRPYLLPHRAMRKHGD